MTAQTSRLLYVEASPRSSGSASRRLGQAFVRRLEERDSGIHIDRLDLWNTDLPEFDGAVIAAKYAKLAGRAMTTGESEAWSLIAAMVERVSSADRIVIATPMWNFGIPYKLKHWIDLITQPGFTFTFDPKTGYSPLLNPRPTLILLSSAGDYRSGASWNRPDLATPYLKAALSFIGLSDPAFVPIGPTVGDPAMVGEGDARAQGDLAALSLAF
ncbi:FMN-dependent NADH-azoreductase [Sphingomonas sp. UYAg733]